MHLTQSSPLAAREAVKGLKRGGVTVIIGAGAMGRMHVDLALAYRPRAIVVADFLEARLQVVRKLFAARAAKAGVALPVVHAPSTPVEKVVDELTNHLGADDVIVAVGSKKAIEGAQNLVGRGAVLNLFGGLKKGDDIVGIDASAVHYRRSTSPDRAAAHHGTSRARSNSSRRGRSMPVRTSPAWAIWNMPLNCSNW
jgi:threonine dehydrogenase-like Zn-dependent dehydrogenase